MDSGIIPTSRVIANWFTPICSNRSVRATFTRYRGDGKQLAIRISSLEGEPLCTATTFLIQWAPKPFHVVIRDWSENIGVYEALLRADVIYPAEEFIQVGEGNIARVCKLKGA